jgi:hypothetical protein
MRTAQISTLYESVPPKAYGGTGRVVSSLTQALVDAGSPHADKTILGVPSRRLETNPAASSEGA